MRRIEVLVLEMVRFFVLAAASFGARRLGEPIEVTRLERLSGYYTMLFIGDNNVRIVQVGKIALAQVVYETLEAQMKLTFRQVNTSTPCSIRC